MKVTKMKPFYSLLAAVQLTAAYTVPPPGPAAPLTPSTCSSWILVTTGMTCASIEASSGLTAAQFLAVNPILSPSSCTLLNGFAYCLAVSGTGATSITSTSSVSTLVTSTTTTTSPITSTTPGNGIATPTPTQVGMTTSCNKFHLVVSGDTCDAIATAAGIALTDFYTWNPTVGNTCGSLWLGYEVCIGLIGSTATTPPSITTTTAGNGITTPTPIQTGMASNCNAFHLVVSGDQCGAIATAAGISLAQFYAWNPAVGSTCSTLFLGYYVCTDIIGVTPTSTVPGNGVATPTPIQTGMATNCDSFHLVVTGDQCGAIATAAGITLDQFYSWNPAVGSTCTLLFLGYYVCIGLL